MGWVGHRQRVRTKKNWVEHRQRVRTKGCLFEWKTPQRGEWNIAKGSEQKVSSLRSMPVCHRPSLSQAQFVTAQFVTGPVCHRPSLSQWVDYFGSQLGLWHASVVGGDLRADPNPNPNCDKLGLWQTGQPNPNPNCDKLGLWQTGCPPKLTYTLHSTHLTIWNSTCICSEVEDVQAADTLEATVWNCQKATADWMFVATTFPSTLWTHGTVCKKKLWQPRQWTASRADLTLSRVIVQLCTIHLASIRTVQSNLPVLERLEVF